MKGKISTIAVLALCSALLVQPVSAENSVETAEPMEVGKAYAYTYFRHIDDEEDGWYSDYDHYYSFTPKATDEYTVEVKGNWINEDTRIEINDESGKDVVTDCYNPYLKRVTATAKLYAGTKYYFDVWAGDESATLQVLTTTVNKHVHEFENKDYEKCSVKGYSDGYIDGYDGGYTKWCRVCEQEEYVTFSAPWSVKLSASKLTFNGKVQKPKVTVYSEDGKKLISYRVSYPKSKAPGKYKLTMELHRWQMEQSFLLADAWMGSNKVFTGAEGDDMRPDTLTNWFRDFIDATDLPPIHLHSLRHTNATLAIANGVAITTVAGQLGHADANTTTKIYAHAIQSAQAEAADRMEDILSGRWKKDADAQETISQNAAPVKKRGRPKKTK
jgi:hypothetical protein